MGLFDHLKLIANMKGEAQLQKLEDPSQVFDYSYTKQLEKLQELRRALAALVTNEENVKLLEAQVEAKQNRYQQQAAAAMQMNPPREDLARQALQAKQALAGESDNYKAQLAQLAGEHQKVETLVHQMESRIQQFQTQKDMAKAQYGAAQAQVQVSEAVAGINKDSEQLNAAMQRAQDKVLNMQAHANALDVLLSENALGDSQNMLAGGQGSDLDHQLAQITSAHNVDEELEALRTSVNNK